MNPGTSGSWERKDKRDGENIATRKGTPTRVVPSERRRRYGHHRTERNEASGKTAETHGPLSTRLGTTRPMTYSAWGRTCIKRFSVTNAAIPVVRVTSSTKDLILADCDHRRNKVKQERILCECPSTRAQKKEALNRIPMHRRPTILGE